MLGTVLGNYRVVERLGEGGMGVVYVGRHETLGHRVVVKVLRQELSRKAEMVRRFFNEAQAATAIRNPGIAQVFDFGTAPDGRAYLVMELLEGETLTARLRRRRLEYVDCCRIGRQIAKVLQASHARGITHRDLKPDNLFLTPDDEVIGGERVKVLDFGIAKLAGETQVAGAKTRTGAIMGTPDYMSPEQCRGAGSVDARTDIYSLGCILFEMTCDRPPFVGEGVGEIVGAHLHVPPPHPQELAPDLPPPLAELIAQMLAKRPDARPQTMAAVSQALEEILGAIEGAPRRAATQAPVPQLGPSSTTLDPTLESTLQTTLSSSAGMTSPRGPGAARRRVLAVGGLVLAGALAAMVIVIALPDSSPAPAARDDEAATAATKPAATDPQPPPQETAEPAAAPTEPAAAPAAAPTEPAAAPVAAPAAPVPESPPPVPETPAAEPPPSPPPAQPPQPVAVAIDSTPPGALVLRSGAVLGKTPFRGTLPYGERDVTLVIRLRGHADRTVAVRPDRPIAQRVKLVASPRPQPARSRDYSVNPFGR